MELQLGAWARREEPRSGVSTFGVPCPRALEKIFVICDVEIAVLLRAHWRPDLAADQIRQRCRGDPLDDEAEHVGFDRAVLEQLAVWVLLFGQRQHQFPTWSRVRRIRAQPTPVPAG